VIDSHLATTSMDDALWNGDTIAEATALLDAALRRGQPGPFQLRLPSPCHATATDPRATDWREIAQRADRRLGAQPPPSVEERLEVKRLPEGDALRGDLELAYG
jgi:RNA polymerase sigma-70 factor, ECF subfamily